MPIDKKLLFITTRRFWPIQGGRELTLYNYCKGLHDVYQYEIWLYSFLNPEQTPWNGLEKPSFIHTVTYAKEISIMTKIKNLISKTFFSSLKFPLQCSLYYSEENRKIIEQLIRDIEPNAVIVDMVRLAPYYSAFADHKCKKILDMDDLLSKRYHDQLALQTRKSSYMGNYARNFGKLLNQLLNGSILQKIVLKTESNLMAKAEKYYAGSVYDSTILVSERETDLLNEAIGTDKAVTVTVGTDYRYFSEAIDAEPLPYSISFVGDLFTPANRDSVEMICQEILPLLPPKVKLYLIGKYPDELKRKHGNSQVEFLGYVDDIRKTVRSTEIYLSPIVYGSGIKTKVIEAMAMGIVVVTNRVGAEGLNVKDGQELFIRETAEGIADVVMRLMDDSILRRKIGNAAQEYVRMHHDWNIVNEAFGRIGL